MRNSWNEGLLAVGMTEFLLVIAVLAGIVAVLYPTLRGAAVDAERERPAPGGAAAARASVADAMEAWHELTDRRRALLQALSELAADREAGNIGDEDYRRARRRYEREAVRLLERMEEAPDPGGWARESASAAGSAEAAGSSARATGSVPGRPRTRIPAAVGWGAAALAFIALAGVALSGALAPRGPDDVMTGGLPDSERTAEGGEPGALMPVDRQRVAELERRVADDSTDVEALVELGHLYLGLQRFDAVARLSMKALSLDAENAEAMTHLGMVLVAANHVQEARDAFARALEIEPDFHEALLYRGVVAFQNRDFGTAIESWERYLEVAPPEANVGRVRAMLEGARQAVGSGTAPEPESDAESDPGGEPETDADPQSESES